jgi:hypothetical protein
MLDAAPSPFAKSQQGRALQDGNGAKTRLQVKKSAKRPDGHFKFLHLWPVKFPQAGRPNYQLFGLLGSDLLSW